MKLRDIPTDECFTHKGSSYKRIAAMMSGDVLCRIVNKWDDKWNELFPPDLEVTPYEKNTTESSAADSPVSATGNGSGQVNE